MHFVIENTYYMRIRIAEQFPRLSVRLELYKVRTWCIGDVILIRIHSVILFSQALVPKGTTVDLSNNLLIRLPENFPTLTHIIKLDLSKNRLEGLATST